MAWAIITIYTSECAQMDLQQLPKTSKFYSRSKKCDIKKPCGWVPPPLGSRKVNSYSAASDPPQTWYRPTDVWSKDGWSTDQGRFVNGRLVKHPSNEEINVRHCETY